MAQSAGQRTLQAGLIAGLQAATAPKGDAGVDLFGARLRTAPASADRRSVAAAVRPPRHSGCCDHGYRPGLCHSGSPAGAGASPTRQAEAGVRPGCGRCPRAAAGWPVGQGLAPAGAGGAGRSLDRAGVQASRSAGVIELQGQAQAGVVQQGAIECLAGAVSLDPALPLPALGLQLGMLEVLYAQYQGPDRVGARGMPARSRLARDSRACCRLPDRHCADAGFPGASCRPARVAAVAL